MYFARQYTVPGVGQKHLLGMITGKRTVRYLEKGKDQGTSACLPSTCATFAV